LHQRHEPRRGERFGDRSHRVRRVLIGGKPPRAVGPAEALLPNNLAVLSHRHRNGRRAAIGKLLANGVRDRVELAALQRQQTAQQKEDASSHCARVPKTVACYNSWRTPNSVLLGPEPDETQTSIVDS